MGDARCADEAPGEAPPPPLEFLDLPADALSAVLALLPPRARARCACTCNLLRELLAGPSLWRELVLHEADADAAATHLSGASARAEGQLRELRVVASMSLRLWEGLQQAVQRNAESLRVVQTGSLLAEALVFPQVETLLSFLSAAASLEVGVYTSAAHVGRLLARSEPGLQRLQLQALFVDGWQEENDRRLHDFIANLGGANHLRRLALLDAPLGMDASALASLSSALPQTLESLELTRCSLQAPEALPALTALFGRPLLELVIENGGGEATAATAARASLFHAASPDGMAAACLAARSATHLRTLSLVGCGLWHNSGPTGPPAWPGVQLIAALTGHHSLTTLCLDDNECRSHAERCAAGAALASLASARGGALRSVSVARSSLRDFGCGPLADALGRGICELQELEVSANGLGGRFMELRLAPALLAAASLRKCGCKDDWGNEFSELEGVLAEVRGRGEDVAQN